MVRVIYSLLAAVAGTAMVVVSFWVGGSSQGLGLVLFCCGLTVYVSAFVPSVVAHLRKQGSPH